MQLYGSNLYLSWQQPTHHFIFVRIFREAWALISPSSLLFFSSFFPTRNAQSGFLFRLQFVGFVST